MGMTDAIRGPSGQMTVEAVIALPVMIGVALVAVNVLQFIGECASFDNLARDCVRQVAAAPAYRQTQDDSARQMQRELEASFGAENMSVSVGVSGNATGYATYTARLAFAPTLFGRTLPASVFGLSVPELTHETSLAIDPYKPGVVI